MISAQRKQTAIREHQVHAKDSGSPEVQISVLTERISALSEHLQSHKKDNSSRRGLTLMVSRRNRLLKFLAAEDQERYTGLIGKLGLRK
ncbi:MAG TPA: 30S ribosomal protein S15 [Phycisphaerales bacterium]|jgi:small subunit ribosomal protein S15|nr:30S ribosomal protein S15 [Phycisphaerales bacterium]